MALHGHLTVADFAKLADLSRQKASAALGRCRAGGAWRGHALRVREAAGRGGAGGRVYLVAIDSLPAELRARLPETPSRAVGAAAEPAPPRRRKRRCDRGKPRVVISLRWDAAAEEAGLTVDAQRDVAAELWRRLRSLWRSGSTPGIIPVTAGAELRRLSESAGMAIREADWKTVCAVPERMIRKARRARIVAVVRGDAGRTAATLTPRIWRDRSDLLPMEVVAGDVHPIDIRVRRDDGSEAYPRMIAFQDQATGRIFFRVFLCPKNEDVRLEHVVATYAEMVTNPDFGVPGCLYLDRGGEFNFHDAADELSWLASKSWPDGRKRGRCVILARPHNPQAKFIEAAFASLEKTVFPLIRGHTGGDRMKSKTQNQGKAPKPFPGTWAEFEKTIVDAMRLWHHKPQQTKLLAGKSPYEMFALFVEQGWRAAVAERDELEIHFSKVETRKVQTGGVLSIRGERYRHDALATLFGETVQVRIPLFGDRSRIHVFDDSERHLCVVDPDRPYRFDDLEGAREQQRRNSEFLKAVRQIEAETDRLDPLAEALRAVPDALPASPLPDTVISISPEYRKGGQAAARLGDPDAIDPAEEERARQSRNLAIRAELSRRRVGA